MISSFLEYDLPNINYYWIELNGIIFPFLSLNSSFILVIIFSIKISFIQKWIQLEVNIYSWVFKVSSAESNREGAMETWDQYREGAMETWGEYREGAMETWEDS